MKQKTRLTAENERSQPTEGPPSRTSGLRRLIINGFIIFLVAFGVRLLALQDNRYEALKVQTAVTEGYRHTGRLLREGGISSFFSAASPLADPNHLGHPPGYSILMAIVNGLTSDTDAAVQLIQITADALAAVLIFLTASALFSASVASIAGLLVAFAPQFTYNSTLLLPDTLAVVPLLLAVYCLVRAAERRHPGLLIAAGALVGVSCWLRANAMMLAPFMVLVIPLLFERGKRMRYALALMGGILLVVAPLSIRNAIVYKHFIPVSLGAGQTFLEGIADYDERGTLGIPNTDMGLMKWESEIYNRPDYYGTLFNPDGVKRDRQRLSYGFSVVRSRPFWFVGVMVRRGLSMLRLERVRLIAPNPNVTHSLEIPVGTTSVWSNSPRDLLANWYSGTKEVNFSLTPEGQMFYLQGKQDKELLISPPVPVQPRTDYVLKLPIRIEQGRMQIRIITAHNNIEHSLTIIEAQDWKPSNLQPLNLIEIPFVSSDSDEVQVVLDNAGAEGINPLVQIGQVQLYALGATSYMWTSPLRSLVRFIQRLFITAVMLPLALFGLFLLIRRRQYRPLVLLLVVPAYYLCFQSALHTEYRYVLAIHYFLFVLVALALHATAGFLWRSLLKLSITRRLFHRSPASAG